MKATKTKSDEELLQELMLIAYKGIFSNPEMYEIAKEHYRTSVNCPSVAIAVAQICTNSAVEFMNAYRNQVKKMNEEY